MKKLSLLFLAAFLFLTPGCKLMPKRVELFQKRVKEFPVQKPREVETQREAASLAAVKAQETLVAAVSEDCSTNVVSPATQTAELTRAVSTSLGPPSSPWKGDVKALAQKLDSNVNALSSRIDSFKNRNDDLAGKKIEDTGIVKVNYFVWLGGSLAGLLLLAFLLSVAWMALKAYGIANPAVGLATGIVSKVASSLSHVAKGGAHEVANLASKGFDQVVAGGENFKSEVSKQFTPEVAEKIKQLFVSEHQKVQDKDVQDAIKAQ